MRRLIKKLELMIRLLIGSIMLFFETEADEKKYAKFEGIKDGDRIHSNSSLIRMRIVLIFLFYGLLPLGMLLLFCIGGAEAEAISGWESENAAIKGLPEYIYVAHPSTAFDIMGDGNIVLISGEGYGSWLGYYWNGTEWVSDPSRVSGLKEMVGYSAATISFNLTGNGNWILIARDSDGIFLGYYWNGKQWISDSSMVAGLDVIPGRAGLTIIGNLTGDGKWTLITGNEEGTFRSYYWSGTQWISDFFRVNGLEDVGSSSSVITGFNIFGDEKWTLITGNGEGTFSGYYWDETQWFPDPSRVNGLGDIGTHSTPTLVYNLLGNGKWVLITGTGDSSGFSDFNGFFYNTVKIEELPSPVNVVFSNPRATTTHINWLYPSQTWNHRVKYSTNPDLSGALWSDWQNDTDNVDIKLWNLQPSTIYYYQTYTYVPWSASSYVNTSVNIFSTNPGQAYLYVNPGDSIQDGIDTLLPEGGIVELLPGVHDVYKTIVINRNNVTIQGTHDSEIRSHDPNKDIFVIPHENPSGAEPWNSMPVLENFLFKGFKVTSTYDWNRNENYIFLAYNVNNVTVEDILDLSHIFGFLAVNPTGGTTSARSRDIFIRNNTIYNSFIALYYSNNIHLVNNYLNGSKGVYGFHMNMNNKYIYIIGNHLINGGVNANIKLYASEFWDIRDNICEGSQKGIYLTQSPKHAIIKNNTVTGGTVAGVMITPQGLITNISITNNRIYNNNGPGILTTHVEYGFHGYETNANITNNVIYNNLGDGIQMVSEYVALNISNNIITNNTGYGINHIAGNISHSYNDIYGNTLDYYNNTIPGTGDIYGDPLFVDATNNDFHLKSTGGQWNGSRWVVDDVTSPCIDAGDPASDYSNEPIPNGGRINMGAYGNTKEASKSPSPIVVSTDDYGNEKNGYIPGDNVSVMGSGLSPITTYKIWIQPDLVGEGDALDASKDPSGLQEVITTDEDGNFSNTLIWPIPSNESIANETFDKYDIVVDKTGLGEGIYNIADDGMDTVNLKNTTPPASITNLQNATGQTWINWTWTNPPDTDFNHTMIYLDGRWKTNTSKPFYNATGLTSNTSYAIGTRTVDLVGNINATWINQTTNTLPDTTPPVITNVTSTGITMNSATISWDTNELSDSAVKYGTSPGSYQLSAYDATDVNKHSVTLTGLSAGITYYYVVNTTDQSGNSKESAEYTFITESAPLPSPAIRGGGGGGGGGALVAPPNVPINPTTGEVTQTTKLTVNGVTLTIPIGTIVKDAKGKPLSTTITILDIPATAESIGAFAAYDFGPSGMTFEPPVDLVIAFHPADMPEGFSESHLVIKAWNGTWNDLDTSIDEERNEATTKVSHFTIFALFGTRPPMPAPTATPSAELVTPSATMPSVAPPPALQIPLRLLFPVKRMFIILAIVVIVFVEFMIALKYLGSSV